MTKVTDIVSEGFIWSVGITRPKPGKERQAAIYISVLVGGVAAVFIGFFLYLALR
ncbi:hypothetical protein [Granulicella paludicola]|uniref:hypothetical protein n=1 Tax=Granulicella paludicola TaxID=474951 RepID=UPI0021DFBC91|nr:hypothetical protein [Granulicella paludicola]